MNRATVILLEAFTFTYLSGEIFKVILGAESIFDIDVAPGRPIFVNVDANEILKGLRVSTNGDLIKSLLLGTQSTAQTLRQYTKGNVRITTNHNKKKSNTGKTAKRQGRNCAGVCRYIPDRDFCPTHIIQEREAVDYDEDYYSGETSAEDNEQYYDEQDDYEADNLLRTQSQLKESNEVTTRRNSSSKRIGGAGLHVVYLPITRLAASKKFEESLKNGTKTTSSKNVKPSTKGKLQRNQKIRDRQPPRVERLPRPALEQEVILRWDRVVERGPFLGGDIVLPKGVSLRPPNNGFQKTPWPGGVVPYIIDPTLNSCRKNTIFSAMDEIEQVSCVRFVERRKERNYLNIRRGNVGCSSYVGMIGGAQQISLSTGCFSRFTVIHELLHSLGFDHEQSRNDRNKHIEIDFNNVLRAKEEQFRRDPDFSGSGFPYDIRSVMHYSAFLFAKDRCSPTIYPRDDKVDICSLGIGNGRGSMTDCDAAKINSLYNCGSDYPQECKI